MLRNPDQFCKAYQAFQNSLSLWAEKKKHLWAVLDTEFWSQANPEIHEKNKHLNKQFPATYWSPKEGHLIDSFFLWSGYLIFSSSFWILMWAETQWMSVPVTMRVSPWAFKVKGHSLVFKRWERKRMEQAGSSSRTASLHNLPCDRKEGDYRGEGFGTCFSPSNSVWFLCKSSAFMRLLASVYK